MIDQFSTRKENLVKIVLDKFQGNKAAFSRATSIHQNHVNLMASPNPKIHRNMGEELARRIETSLGLPPKWMDAQHGQVTQVHAINSVPIDPAVARAIIPCGDFDSLVVTNRWEMRSASRITNVESLIMATISTPEMEPILRVGQHVIIDTGRKAVSTDGIYILEKGGAAFIRSVRKQMDGAFILSAANPEYRSDKNEQLKGMRVVGKVVSVIEETEL